MIGNVIISTEYSSQSIDFSKKGFEKVYRLHFITHFTLSPYLFLLLSTYRRKSLTLYFVFISDLDWQSDFWPKYLFVRPSLDVLRVDYLLFNIFWSCGVNASSKAILAFFILLSLWILYSLKNQHLHPTQYHNLYNTLFNGYTPSSYYK